MNSDPQSILMLSLHGYVSASPRLGRPDTGGQVVYVLEAARHLGALGLQVDLVTRRFNGQPAVESLGPGVRIWRVPFGGRDFLRKEDMHDHLKEFVSRFIDQVHTLGLRYDLVNSHYWDAGWAGQQIARRLGLLHVHTPHSLGWWKRHQMRTARDDLGGAYRFDERIRKERWLYRRCDHVIATSESQRQILSESYGVPSTRITTIAPGIDTNRFFPVGGMAIEEARARVGLTAHDVYSVGRAANNKGYDLLIRSLPGLTRLRPGARLVLAVGAHDDADQQRIAQWQELAGELGVADSIEWRGHVPDESLADCYRAAGVFALPSRYEPFGMTAIEAMACGAPTVLTIHGGLHERVEYGQHALWVDPQRPEELSVALSLPMQYPRLRQRLAKLGARWARLEFGWTRIVRQMLDVFESARLDLGIGAMHSKAG